MPSRAGQRVPAASCSAQVAAPVIDKVMAEVTLVRWELCCKLRTGIKKGRSLTSDNNTKISNDPRAI